MEVWGGIECTINRVGDRYFDQMDYDNLYHRPEWLEQILDLGIKTLRFPVLWEKVWPDNTRAPNWAVKKQLELLKKNNVRVIAGLVHHGSGPNYAQIQDVDFADKLALYGRMVAEEFPWINDYTPINEPLTTARFCGLYGLWYPHSRDDKVFLNILINECRATILAMRAIREVNSKARLILTEDLTRIHGTKELEEQINFENHRRWLSIDLLCGKVDDNHPLWEYLMEHGIKKDQLRFFTENPMVPDLLGFNYYVTSERYLDHKIDQHPIGTHGGNGYKVYADIEAVRHPDANLAGLANLMREAAQRYSLPMAITEAHLCCGREDQLRWLKSVWDDCITLNDEDVNIVAVTFWSLFGAYGWDRLLTERKGTYECGAFDLSSGFPRKTAIANLIAALAHCLPYDSPVIRGNGWWQRQPGSEKNSRPILIIGGPGTYGEELERICKDRNLNCMITEQKEIDITDPGQFQTIMQMYFPWAVINVSLLPVDPEILANACSTQNLQLLNICDQTITPVYIPQILQSSIDLLIDQESEVYRSEIVNK